MALATAAASWIVPRWRTPTASLPPGEIVGANRELGHRLRLGNLPPIEDERRGRIAIIGGGIAGLAAAWKLQKSGLQDFELLELDDVVGGNARSGKNAGTPYPWGAHYLPIPPASATAVIELLRDLGIIVGHDDQGRAIYDERQLCADLHERLLIRGTWQDGVVPQRGVSTAEREQIAAFFAAIAEWKRRRGSDGRLAFAIPLDQSSQDPEILALDRMTMAEWMRRQDWDSPHLRWYVDYCCRDDFGCGVERTSAWAGLHYFASRTGQAANAPGNAVLTWPEGNGHLVRAVASALAAHVRSRSLVFNVDTRANEVAVDYYDVERNRSCRLVCDAAVFAAPRFIAGRVVRALRDDNPSYLTAFHYSPWLVANVTVRSLPGGRGAPLAWDNVSFDSRSLGYVVATHQELRQYPSRESVLTYYWPLDDLAPNEARKQAMARTYEDWAKPIIADLERMHPGIAGDIRRLDVWLWGHGMIIPEPGFIWGEARRAAQSRLGRLWFAHSDMSGISIFEEAWTRGVDAAELAMAELGIPFHSSSSRSS